MRFENEIEHSGNAIIHLREDISKQIKLKIKIKTLIYMGIFAGRSLSTLNSWKCRFCYWILAVASSHYQTIIHNIILQHYLIDNHSTCLDDNVALLTQ